MKIGRNAAIIMSGLTWIGIGVLLLTKGFSLILSSVSIGQAAVLLPHLQVVAGGFQQAALILVGIGLFVGFLKGRLVLEKSASRIITRIVSLPNPCSLSSVYSRSYLILIASMMGLGMGLRWIPIPYDLKGVIDVAIGSALINGSAFYFRYFATPSKEIKK